MVKVNHFHRVFNWDTEQTKIELEQISFKTELAAQTFIHAMRDKFAETVRLELVK